MSNPIDHATSFAPRSFESVAATIFASATLASSGDWTRSSIVDVVGARRITLLVDYDPAGAAGYLHLVPLIGATAAQPAAADDSWFIPTHNDGVITEVSLDTGLPSGADYSAVPGFGEVTQRGLLIRFDGADNATDEYRYAITLDVSMARWFHFIAAEKGNTGSPGTLAVTYVLSA